jgi:hypothetical protein
MSWNHFNEEDWKDYEYGWIKYVVGFVIVLAAIIVGACWH